MGDKSISHGPQVIVDKSWAAGVCPRTVRKWLARFRAEGVAGLQDHSSRPHRAHRPAPLATVEQIAALQRLCFTGRQIAQDLGVSPATVSRVLRRLGLNRIAALEPAEPVRRYERERPGELIHIDIKKLGCFERTGHRITGDRTGQSNSRGIGWEHLHLAVDDYSRLAYSEVLPDEKRRSCLRFLFYALRFFRRHGVAVEHVMTDNGPAFRSRRYARALRRMRIRHLRTRPIRPKPTARPSASCRHPCANGPTPKAMRRQSSAAPNSLPSSSVTIGKGRTYHSAASVSPRITC